MFHIALLSYHAPFITNNKGLSITKRVEKAMIAVFGDGSKTGVTLFVTTNRKKDQFKRLK